MLWLLACKPPAPVNPVLVRPVVEVPMERPARFSADASLLWTDEAGAPPFTTIEHALCVNAPGVRNAVAAQIHDHPEAVPSRVVLLNPCEDPSWCRWLRKRAVADVPTRASPWWSALAFDCRDPESEAEAEGAGYEIWLLWLQRHPGDYDPRVAERVAEAMAHDDQRSAAAGLRILAGWDTPQAERDLLALYRAVPRRWKDPVALSLWGRTSDEAIDALATVCARVDDPRCSATRPNPLDQDQIAASDDPGALYDQLPTYSTAVTDALRQCVVSGSAAHRRCAVALIDHGARISLDGGDPDLEDLRTAMALGDGLVPKLISLGVPLDPASGGGSVPELLIRAGLARRLDRLYDPDWLLMTIAALAGKPDLVFETLPPSDEAPVVEGRVPRTALFAWDGQHRWRGLEEAGDGEDVPDVIGFANAVLAKVGSPSVAAVDLDRQVVVVADRAVVEGLAQEHLLAFAPPPEPEPAASPGAEPTEEEE